MAFAFSANFDASFAFRILSLQVLGKVMTLESLLRRPGSEECFPFSMDRYRLFSSGRTVSWSMG